MYATLLWTSYRFQKICKPLVVYRFYCLALYHSQTPCHVINNIIILSINKHLLIGPDAYPLESIKLHIAWFAGRDIAKHTARGNIDRLTGSDVRTSSNFTLSICYVNVLMV